MTDLDFLYNLIIGINFIFSIYFKNQRRKYIFLYFGFIMIVETLCGYYGASQKWYNFLDIVAIMYFYFLYQIDFINKSLLIILTVLFLVITLYFTLFSNTNYSINAGISSSLFLIILPISWFYTIITKNETFHIKIYKRQLFWISSSLILFSVFFIFRMVPMYWLVKNDFSFLLSLKYIFQITTIISYLLFLKGLFCKI